MFKAFFQWIFSRQKKDLDMAWPFPVASKDFSPRPKRKYVRKATTRTAPKNETAKKAATKRKKAGK